MNIEIIKTDITGLDVDAVVNAANSGLREGSGVCGAIFREAGSAELTSACKAIGGCPTGSAVITPGFKLRAKYIIHAVGPIWNGGKNGEERALYGCYQAAMRLAMDNDCTGIAFPLISSGIFGYPKEDAWAVAIKSVADFQNSNNCDIKVFFAVIEDRIKDIGDAILSSMK